MRRLSALAALNGKEVLLEADGGRAVHGSTGAEAAAEAAGGSWRLVDGQDQDLIATSTRTPAGRAARTLSPHGNVVEADIIIRLRCTWIMKSRPDGHRHSLQGYQLHGQEIRVQMSTWSVRPVPGMDKADLFHRCSHGHWSKTRTPEVSAGYGAHPVAAD